MAKRQKTGRYGQRLGRRGIKDDIRLMIARRVRTPFFDDTTPIAEAASRSFDSGINWLESDDQSVRVRIGTKDGAVIELQLTTYRSPPEEMSYIKTSGKKRRKT